MSKKRKTDGRLMPSGETMREKWYALARRYCGIMANRQRTKGLCKRCFAMRLRRRDWRNIPLVGCAGCVEMDSFFDEAAALITGKEINQEYTILC